MSENIKIIKKDNINVIQELFSKFKKAVVFGKGPTFKVIEKDEDTLFCCVNDTINFIEKCDLLVMNDIETSELIDLTKLKNTQCILVPYHIHYQFNPRYDITYNDFIKKIQDYFHGYIIIHNLATSKKRYDDVITLPVNIAYNSCHTGCDFIFGFLSNIEYINTYGFGIHSTINYEARFKNIAPHPYTKKRINAAVSYMNSIQLTYKKKIIYN